MADLVWKGFQPKVIGRSRQLSLNKVFDQSTPSMRKGRNGEWKKKWNGKKNNGENSGPLMSLPVDRLTACSPATTTLVPTLSFYRKKGLQGYVALVSKPIESFSDL